MLPIVMVRDCRCCSEKPLRFALLAGAISFLALAAAAVTAAGQTPPAVSSVAPSAGTPIIITLDEAIRRAEASEPAYAASAAASQSSQLDRSIARAGLLPSVTYFNQGLYTEASGAYGQLGQGGADLPLPRFIANNGVREYISQALVNETLGLAPVAAVHRADASAALAQAELEIARRGLVVTVTDLFYGSLAADHKRAIAKSAYKDAADFTALTTKRENEREAARADVVKAELTEQQRWREMEDAKVSAERARLELGVLLFPDPLTPYALQADETIAPLAPFADVEQTAAKSNPELKSALAALSLGNADVMAARAAYLPDVGLNVTYGIDAPQFAVNGPETVRNLGYSASVTVDVPVWDWLATEHKVKQSEIRRDAARVALSAAQRQLIAQLQEAYTEAQAARDDLASLDESVKTAAESLRLTRLAYEGGDALVLEVVDAQNAYVSAENAREDGRVRYEAARAALETLTGAM
ncbi:MAG: TolC family protein [Terracidiphilus sp.]